MVAKPKAGGSKKPPEKEKAKEKPQSERFIETARSIGAENNTDHFEAVIRKIVRPKVSAQRRS